MLTFKISGNIFKMLYFSLFSGLRKQKQYDWKDSNLALFGSDVEKNVKSEYAVDIPCDRWIFGIRQLIPLGAVGGRGA